MHGGGDLTKRKVVVDPDFGPIEVPPPPSRAEFERVGREIVSAMVKTRAWPKGSLSKCTVCGKRTFEGRDDLEHRIARPGGYLIFRHLRGGRCAECGAQSLEIEDLMTVEEEAGLGRIGDYEAKVCNIGSGTLGTYWPKDVVRNLNLDPSKKAFIEILDSDTVLVTFRRVPEGIIARDPGRLRRKKRGSRRRLWRSPL